MALLAVKSSASALARALLLTELTAVPAWRKLQCMFYLHIITNAVQVYKQVCFVEIPNTTCT